MGDADYLYAFQQVVMPIAYDFNPDLVISKFSMSVQVERLNGMQSPLDSMPLLAISLVAAL